MFGIGKIQAKHALSNKSKDLVVHATGQGSDSPWMRGIIAPSALCLKNFSTTISFIAETTLSTGIRSLKPLLRTMKLNMKKKIPISGILNTPSKMESFSSRSEEHTSEL